MKRVGEYNIKKIYIYGIIFENHWNQIEIAEDAIKTFDCNFPISLLKFEVVCCFKTIVDNPNAVKSQ